MKKMSHLGSTSDKIELTKTINPRRKYQMTQINLTLDSEILHGLFSSKGRDEAFSKLLKCLLNQVLNAQAAEQVGGERYERS